MKLSATDQDSIVTLLTRIYNDIYAIEEEFQLLVGGHDFRPRIDYFHDAIRAFTSKDDSGRLAIELLAYDVSCLRYIASLPLAPFKPDSDIMSPGSDIVAVKPGLSVKPKRPDRAVRERLSDLYQHYAVLFSALLKPTADRDAQERTEALNQDVGDIATLISHLEGMLLGKTQLSTLSAVVQHLEEEGLRQLLAAFISQEKYKKKDDIKKLIAFLKKYTADKDEKIAAVDKAHTSYAMSQLGIFEESKDLIKKMAAQGTNIVGNFVQASIAQTRREMGR